MESITDTGGNWRQWRILGWGIGALALLVPLISMQFTDEVNWKLGDFVVFGAMIATVGVTIEVAVRMTSNFAFRAAVAIAALGAFLLVWANLAVGIIGNENNEANLLYFGVLVIGIIGALVTRFRAHGLSVVMYTMTAALFVIAIVAFLLGLGSSSPNWPRGIVLATGILGVLWTVSALLFRRAGLEQREQGTA